MKPRDGNRINRFNDKNLGVIGESIEVPSWRDNISYNGGLGVRDEDSDVRREHTIYDTGFDETFENVERDFDENIFFNSNHQRISHNNPLFNEVMLLDSSIKIAAEEIPKTIMYHDRNYDILHKMEKDVAMASTGLLNKCLLELETTNQYPLVDVIQENDKCSVTYRHFHVHRETRHLVEMQSPLSWVCDLPWNINLMLGSKKDLHEVLLEGNEKKIKVKDVLQVLYNSCPDIPGNEIIKEKLHYAIDNFPVDKTETRNLEATAWDFPSTSSTHTHSWKHISPDGTILQLFVGVLNVDIFKPWLNPRIVKFVQESIMECGKQILKHHRDNYVKKMDYNTDTIPNFINIDLIIDKDDRRYVLSINPFAGPDMCTVSHVYMYQFIGSKLPCLGILKLPNNLDEIGVGGITPKLKKTEKYVYVGAYKGKPMDNKNIYAIHSVACAKLWGTGNYKNMVVSPDRYQDYDFPSCKVTRITAAPWDIMVSSYVNTEHSLVETIISIVNYPPFGTQFTTKKKVFGNKFDGGEMQMNRTVRRRQADYGNSTSEDDTGRNDSHSSANDNTDFVESIPHRRNRNKIYYLRGLADTTEDRHRVVMFHSDNSEEAKLYLDKVAFYVDKTMKEISRKYRDEWPENVKFWEYLAMNAEAWGYWRMFAGKIVRDHINEHYLLKSVPPTSYWYFTDSNLEEYHVFRPTQDEIKINRYKQFLETKSIPGWGTHEHSSSSNQSLTNHKGYASVAPPTNISIRKRHSPAKKTDEWDKESGHEGDASRQGSDHDRDGSRQGSDHDGGASRQGSDHDRDGSRQGSDHDGGAGRQGSDHDRDASRQGSDHDGGAGQQDSNHEEDSNTSPSDNGPDVVNDTTTTVRDDRHNVYNNGDFLDPERPQYPAFRRGGIRSNGPIRPYTGVPRQNGPYQGGSRQDGSRPPFGNGPRPGAPFRGGPRPGAHSRGGSRPSFANGPRPVAPFRGGSHSFEDRRGFRSADTDDIQPETNRDQPHNGSHNHHDGSHNPQHDDHDTHYPQLPRGDPNTQGPENNSQNRHGRWGEHTPDSVRNEARAPNTRPPMKSQKPRTHYDFKTDELVKKANELMKEQARRLENSKPRGRDPDPVPVHTRPVDTIPEEGPALHNHRQKFSDKKEPSNSADAGVRDRQQVPETKSGRRATRRARHEANEFHDDEEDDPWLDSKLNKPMNTVGSELSSCNESLKIKSNEAYRNLERRLNELESKIRLSQHSENHDHLMNVLREKNRASHLT